MTQKTRAELIAEIAELRQQLADWEQMKPWLVGSLEASRKEIERLRKVLGLHSVTRPEPPASPLSRGGRDG